jgi:probable HAF family extracellular repeat protein
MRVGSLVALVAPVAALAIIGCSGDGVTEPGREIDLRGGKPQTYQAELLPLPPGAIGGIAFGVNRTGQIVGWATFPENVDRAIRWDPGAAPVFLGALPGFRISEALTISDAGDIVGVSEGPDGSNWRPVRWPAGGEIQDLGKPPEASTSNIVATNKGGDVAWLVSTDPGVALHLLRHGVLTTADATQALASQGNHLSMNDHGVVAFGSFVWSSNAGWTVRSSAYADPGIVNITGINKRDDVVAEDFGSTGRRGTLYPRKGPPVTFGLDFVPKSINNFGVIAGESSFFPNALAKIRYADGTIVELPKPSGIAMATNVNPFLSQISDEGIVVGYSIGTLAGGGQVLRATVWRPTK